MKIIDRLARSGAIILLQICSFVSLGHSAGYDESNVAALRKMDVFLKTAVLDAEVPLRPKSGATKFDFPAERKLALVVRAEPTGLPEYVAGLGGSIGTSVGNLHTVHMPLLQIRRFAEDGRIERLALGAPAYIANENAALQSGVDKARNGTAPLTESYLGEGVVVGIIDTGIDIFHDEFRVPDSRLQSRILSIWDQNADGGGVAPQDYDYGVEWRRQAIETALSANDDSFAHSDSNGHGSHVAATAAGSLTGMAPRADLVVVGFRNLRRDGETFAENVAFEGTWAANVIDATAYIIAQAEQAGKRASINASIGVFHGPRNGLDLGTQMLDALLDEHPQTVFSAIMGNEGAQRIHWGGFELQADSLWTYFYSGINGEARAYLTFESRYLGTSEFAVGVDSVIYSSATSTQVDGVVARRQSNWISAQEIVEGEGIEIIYQDSPETTAGFGLSGAVSSAGIVEILIDAVHVSGIVGFEQDGPQLRPIPRPSTYLKLLSRGAGIFHSWMYNPSQTLPPAIANRIAVNDRYIAADNDVSGRSFPAYARNVLSVGSYVNVDSYRSVRDETIFHSPGMPAAGRLSTFSSRGPGADGLLKPDICAPGENVVSAHSRSATRDLRFITDEANAYRVRSGTSMATPVVCGAAALLMEAEPTISAAGLRSRLRQSARRDGDTFSHGDLPNNAWGYGKLDLFAALQRINTSLASIDAAPLVLRITPNPADELVRLTIGLPENGPARLTVFNALGQAVVKLVDEWRPAGRATLDWQTGRQAAGMYFVVLETAEQRHFQALAIVH